MNRPRVIPCLLLKGEGLVKTARFKRPIYVGDPINTVRIFNEKEVDELVLLDITATRERRHPRLKVIADVASECFMPLAYGGGVRSAADAKAILGVGVEKIIINTAAIDTPTVISKIAMATGTQAVVVSIDARRSLFGRHKIYTRGGTHSTAIDPVEFARQAERLGAGEILLTSIDRDGTMQGYDFDLVRNVSQAVGIPVIACGGAGSVEHFRTALHDAGASAVAAGSLFVFQGRHRAVLISYPSARELARLAA